MAALATFCAALLLFGPTPGHRLARLVPRRAGPGSIRTVTRRAAPVAAITAIAVAGWLVAGVTGMAISFAVGAPAATALSVWRGQVSRAAARAGVVAVTAACESLAGLLRLGHVPATALLVASRDSPVLAEAAAVQQVGGEVAPCLRRLGGRPGYSGLAELGLAWQVAERTGASLSATLDALAERLVAARAVGDVVQAELSAPRATGRLLAVLPVAGLVLGYGLGGDPLAFLIGSLPGQLCLFGGVALGCSGVLWTERIAQGSDE